MARSGADGHYRKVRPLCYIGSLVDKIIWYKEDFMSSWTREERMKLNMGKDGWSTYSPKGEIYTVQMSDGPIGVRHHGENGDIETAVAYPSMQMLSCTWDMGLVERCAQALADDCIEHKVDVLLGPGVNIKRIPTCGRNFEYASEDPVLAGYVGYHYIYGLQSCHVGACLKHYCCNNQEEERYWISAEVDEQTLREIYLKPFEIACKAKPWMIMSSYNRVNGTHVNEDRRLHEILRKEFGFEGTVVSDWWAVRRPSKAVNAGTNLIMPYHEKTMEKLISATDVEEATLHRNNQKVEELAQRCAEEKEYRKIQFSVEERRNIAQEVEENAIVLLKNNGVLPLKDKTANLPIMGNAAEHYYRGGGSSEVHPELPYEKLHESLQNYGAIGAHFAWNEETGTLQNCVKEAKTSSAVIVAVGNPNTIETEEKDRQNIRLSPEEEFYIHTLASVNKNVIVVIYAGAAIDMSGWIDEVGAVVWAGYGGERVNRALARILLGEVNPSGKLTETFPIALEDVPAYHAKRTAEKVYYSEGRAVGYRYFATEKIPVLFPFGFGLSYSKFQYEDLAVVDKGEMIEAVFAIENLSEVDGREIAQLYIGLSETNFYELKGFTKILIPASSKVMAKITVEKNLLKNYDIEKQEWKPYEGKYMVCVGKNCMDLSMKKEIVLKG